MASLKQCRVDLQPLWRQLYLGSGTHLARFGLPVCQGMVVLHLVASHVFLLIEELSFYLYVLHYNISLS